MRKINLKEWEMTDGGAKSKVTLTHIFNALFNQIPDAKMPRGLDKFRMFSGISKAFEAAKESKVLVLEEAEFSYIKDLLDKDLPARWGRDLEMMKEIENFLDTKPEKTEQK